MVVAGASGSIAHQTGDWVVISPAPRGTDGVEFNIVVRRSGGTFVQANTITFNDPLALTQLHLNNLYFEATSGGFGEFITDVVLSLSTMVRTTLGTAN